MFDIDFVVMWVDGNDPAWLKEKEQYTPKTDKAQKNTGNRFRDWGLMQYWFRAVEEYAPWVRKVHFVTWGHLPPFLNTSCPKLNIVNHKDYLPKEILPTYNSEAIEMNLHRIPDLADHFVLFNDDMFLGKPLKPDDFFDTKSGFPKMTFAEVPLRFIGPARPWEIVRAVDLGISNRHFKKQDYPTLKYFGKRVSRQYPVTVNIKNLVSKVLFPSYYAGFTIAHAPVGLLKSAYEEIWEKEPEILWRTTSERYRELGDANHWSVMMWQLVSDQFEPKRPTERYFDTTQENVDEVCEVIRKKTAESLCINDPDWLDDYKPVADKIISAFEEVFPNKSTFER